MRWNRIAGTVLTTGALALAAVTLSSQSPPASRAAKPAAKAAAKPVASKAQLERGEYLVTIMGCGDCHTPGTLYGDPDFTRRLSGSELGWQGPWGVTYPRNLTPDPETGIASWSENDIITAFRTGHRPD